jgi:DHA2 family multidrug resistance protein
MTAVEDKPLVQMAPVPKAVATTLMMAATILVVLDQTIATIALPQMQAALGATPDTISWVLSAYIMATAVATPLTGWLTGRFDRSRLFGVCVLGFTISSALCGMAVTLPMMVAARVAQGAFGAFLMPMSQAFLYDMNSPSLQVRAITLWGVGSMAGPMIGPVLGGYLTEWLNWRWVFFINVPIGLVAAVGIFATLPRFPSVRRAFDHAGFILIAIALCALQLALDRGTQQDWFDSTEIILELGICVAAFWMLFFHLRSAPSPIISITLFTRRTFSVAMLFALTVMPTVIAATALMPSLLQVLLGYPVVSAGLLLIPRSITLTLGIIIGGRLLKYVDARLQIACGLTLVAVSLWMQSGFDLVMDENLVIIAGLVQGLGAGMTMTIVNLAAIAGAPPALRSEAAALYSLFRSVGGALLISISTAVLARNIQVNHEELGAVIGGKPFQLSETLGGAYLGERIAMLTDAEVTRQAMMIAYINDFWLMMWLMILMLPLALLINTKPTLRAPPAMAAAD